MILRKELTSRQPWPRDGWHTAHTSALGVPGAFQVQLEVRVQGAAEHRGLARRV